MCFFISFLAGIVLFYSFHYFPFSTVFISLMSSVYLTVKKKFFLIFILLSGVLYAFLRYEPSQDLPYIKDPITVKGVFESYPVQTESGKFRQAFRIESVEELQSGNVAPVLNSGNTEYDSLRFPLLLKEHSAGRFNDIAGKEIILFSDREFDAGTECKIALKFLKSRKRLNPGQQMGDEVYANLLEIYDSGNKKVSLNSKMQEYRYRINRYIEDNFKKDSGAFVASITTGQRVYMSEELRDAFNATGLAHILSISGTHFGLFSVLLFSIFKFFIKMFPYRILQRITMYVTPSQAAAMLCFPFMLSYLGLSGGSIPAIRSFIMITLFLAGLVIGRKGFWLNSLLFAACILVVWEPESLFSLSFQLSFLAVLFIGFSVQSKEDEKKGEKKICRYIRNVFLMTLFASIGTAPLVAYYFHYFSIISPISNLFIAPLIGFILIPLSVFSSFIFLITGHFIFAPIVSWVADASIFLVDLLSHVPFADIKIPAFPPGIILFFYSGFIFYFLFKKRYLLIIPFIPLVVYLVLTVFEKKEMTVTFLDAGQGDSSVVELPDRKTMVIDTGKTGRETSSFLKYKGEKVIDFLVLSHSHPDHAGGLDHIVRNFKVKEIWDNGRIILPDMFNNIKRHSLNRGDVIEGKEYKIYVLHPYHGFYTMNRNEYIGANNEALVLKVDGNNKSILFAGDIEEEAEENINHLGKWIKSDVVKIPHHGGKTSAYEPFFRTVSPDIAVISVGRDNAFGHPHQEILDVLGKIRIFRTDLNGAVKIKETVHGFEIRTFGDFQFEKARSLHDEMKNIKRLAEIW